MRAVACAALVLAAGCYPKGNGRTGDDLVDLCLHWTSCVQASLPTSGMYDDTLAGCVRLGGGVLPWQGEALRLSAAQRRCIIDAGLDCAKVLACSSAPAPAPCPTTTWTCNGDVLERCDELLDGGDRVFDVDCAAAGLSCVPSGNRAVCAAGSCDPKTFGGACLGTMPLLCNGGLQTVSRDCADLGAVCDGGSCVGTGPPCGDFGCDGNATFLCLGGRETQPVACYPGQRCAVLSTPGHSLAYCSLDGSCGSGPLLGGPPVDPCVDSMIGLCAPRGEVLVDCKALGYRGCEMGRCTP